MPQSMAGTAVQRASRWTGRECPIRSSSVVPAGSGVLSAQHGPVHRWRGDHAHIAVHCRCSGGGREGSYQCRRTPQYTTPRQRHVTPGPRAPPYCLPAHGGPMRSRIMVSRTPYPRSTPPCDGRLVGRKEAAFGQCSAGAARARRGECSYRCRTVPVGVNDSTSARKVSCSGRAAQLVMWVHREAMKPAYVCVVECLSGSVWRGGASVPPRSILFRLE